MSVNSKMTAIADQIRGLRGISGSLSLDTMNTRLEEVRGYISDAFTAIGNKGGSLPGYQVSPNLATAIDSIPTDPVLQSKSGTFTTDSNGGYYADCGFLPDVVIMYRVNGNTTDYMTFFLRDVGFTDYQSATMMYEGTIKGTCYGLDIEELKGFNGNLWGYNWDWSGSTFTKNLKVQYTAIKFV